MTRTRPADRTLRFITVSYTHLDVYKRQTLQRMVDREAKRAEGKGVGYDRWAAKHNLKQMAATVTAYQQYGFSSPEELDEACSAAYAAMQESLTELKQVEKTLDGKKELQRQVPVSYTHLNAPRR